MPYPLGSLVLQTWIGSSNPRMADPVAEHGAKKSRYPPGPFAGRDNRADVRCGALVIRVVLVGSFGGLERRCMPDYGRALLQVESEE